jgi:large subunit ribosomal protein L16
VLSPKRVKYRKQQAGNRRGKAYRGGTVAFGQFGLKALEPAWITNKQIEAARVALTRRIKRGGKVWIRVFPHKPVTVVRPGRILFEIEGIPESLAATALRLAADKLPIKTKFVKAH